MKNKKIEIPKNLKTDEEKFEFFSDRFAEFLEEEEIPSEAEENLRAGYSVTFRDERWPEKTVRAYPDGRLVFIDFDENYKEIELGEAPGRFRFSDEPQKDMDLKEDS